MTILMTEAGYFAGICCALFLTFVSVVYMLAVDLEPGVVAAYSIVAAVFAFVWPVALDTGLLVLLTWLCSRLLRRFLRRVKA